MSISNIVYVIFSLLGMSSLFSIALFVWLLSQQSKIALNWSLPSDCLTIQQKIFLTFVLMGFLFCLFQGSEHMLFWLSDRWINNIFGGHDNISGAVAFLFALGVGLPFLKIISNVPKYKYLVETYEEKSYGLERLITAADDIHQIDQLLTEFNEKIDFVRDGLKERSHDLRTGNRIRYLPECQRIDSYKRMINFAKLLRNRLVKEVESK